MKICTRKPVYDMEKWITHYVKDMRRDEMAENTITLYQRLLEHLKTFVDLSDIKSIKEIDAEYILRFLEWMEGRHAEKTGNDRFIYTNSTKMIYLLILRTFFDYIEEKAELEEDGSQFTFSYEFKEITKKRGRKAKKKREIKHLSYDEIDKLISYLDTEIEFRGRHYDYIYSLAIKLMLYAGLRVSECLSLKFGDLSIYRSKEGEEIIEIRLEDTKSGTEQYVPMKLSHIKEEYQYLLAKEVGRDQYIVSNKRFDSKLDRSNLYVKVNMIYLKAGIVDKKGLHILRHTSAMMLLDKVGDITYVKELLRHSNITTTMVYVHRSVKQLGERVV